MLRGNTFQRGLLFMWLCLAAVSITLGWLIFALSGPRGETNGVILNDGSILLFPPEGMQISIKVGMPFAASGLGTRNNDGQSLEAISVGTHLSALQPLYRGVP